jgi:hypothetical protein
VRGEGARADWEILGCCLQLPENSTGTTQQDANLSFSLENSCGFRNIKYGIVTDVIGTSYLSNPPPHL